MNKSNGKSNPDPDSGDSELTGRGRRDIPGPATVHLSVTHRCTQRCRMCLRWQWPAGTELGTADIQRLLHELAALGTTRVTITGGEPTVREDFPQLVALSLEQGLQVAVVTNGTLLLRRLDQLARVPGVTEERFSVAISLLGADAATHEDGTRTPGSFAAALALLERLRELQINAGLFYTLLPSNVTQMRDAVLLACRYRARFLRFGFLHGRPDLAFGLGDLSRIRSEVEAVYSLRKKRNLLPLCPTAEAPRVMLEGALYRHLFAGLITQRDLDEGTLARCVLERREVRCEYAPRSAFIDPGGDIYPCYYCYASNEDFERYRGLRDEYRMGNVLEPSFREAWTSARYRAFLARVEPIRPGDKLLHAVCAQCVMCLGFAERQGKKIRTC